MSAAIKALIDDGREKIGRLIGGGIMSPADGRDALEKSGLDRDEVQDWVFAALEHGNREECEECKGTGAIDTAWSGSDPCCVVCDGAGSVPA